MTALEMFKKQAALLYTMYGVKYSDKDPAIAAWMLDTLELAKESGDATLRDCCAAGLMCRYWSIFTKEKIGVEDDYDTKISYGWEAIEYALKYKVWQDADRKVNADQAVKRCIKTIFLQHNYNANLDKARANNFCSSIDEAQSSSDSDRDLNLGDVLPDESDLAWQANENANYAVRSLIQNYINKKKIVEAIILDTIAFNDVEKETRKTVSYTDVEGKVRRTTQVYKEFWPFRCVQLLSSLPETYGDYFEQNYKFNPVEFNKALAALRAANNQKLYRYVRSTLADAKKVSF